MSTLSLDPDRGLRLLSGVEGVAHRVETRLRFHRGEWFLDQTAGVPYLPALLGRNFAPALIANEIAGYASSVEGVDRVVLNEYDFANGRLDISFTIETPFGQTAIGVELG